MATRPKSHVPHGEGPSRHTGTQQHGWSPDVDSTHTQENPSAKRSFDPPQKEAGGAKSRKGSRPGKADEGVPVESSSRSGEDLARKGSQKGHHDLGPRGRSQRPSGGKDNSAFTGVEEKDSKRLRPG
ncbi:hypothetical protein CP980_33910 [Streptomyces vinaceus]|uniref:Uncharacterized protein n=1 Tax=Streptomyces vinaceus TaxID=1960 RepID=A0A5J6JDL8_STRVI|nr:hypothetical protein [Streptomyces vinaceus]QEV49397.1 hypothetical protein CP980_33910 [Streptomyces vinaceus]GHE45116.1 hypothetical protein GCM10017778_30820 [Streptomyces vinaceus]